MLVELSSRNQVTLPKAIVNAVPKAEYFEVTEENGRIVLTPIRITNANAVQAKLEALGITEKDLEDAVEWARGRG